MSIEKPLEEITPLQQTALLCAVNVRCGLEEIHGRDDGTLPDSIMKEVNTIIRDRIYQVLCAFDNKDKSLLDKIIMLIPDYLELPKIPIYED
jgi:hypothetical protein